MPQKIEAAHMKESHDLLIEIVAQGNSMIDTLEAIEAHLREQNGKVNKSCDEITKAHTSIAKLETINRAFYGVLAVIGGVLIKMFQG